MNFLEIFKLINIYIQKQLEVNCNRNKGKLVRRLFILKSNVLNTLHSILI